MKHSHFYYEAELTFLNNIHHLIWKLLKRQSKDQAKPVEILILVRLWFQLQFECTCKALSCKHRIASFATVYSFKPRPQKKHRNIKLAFYLLCIYQVVFQTCNMTITTFLPAKDQHRWAKHIVQRNLLTLIAMFAEQREQECTLGRTNKKERERANRAVNANLAQPIP